MPRRVKVLLRRLQVEALENAAGWVEQNDIGLWLVDRLGIESDQAACDPYRFQGSPGREASFAASHVGT